MDTQKIRLFLIFAMMALGMLLADKWHQSSEAAKVVTSEVSALPGKAGEMSAVPTVGMVPGAEPLKGMVNVETDVFAIKIDPNGADFIKTELKQFPISGDNAQPFSLLNRDPNRYYIVQGGLISDMGPDSRERGRAVWVSEKTDYRLTPASESLVVPFIWRNGQGLTVEKRIEFIRGNYVATVSYFIKNNMSTPWHGRMYGQIKRDEKSSSGLLSSTSAYTGAAYHQEDEPYTKLSFSDMRKKPLDMKEKGGWVAMMEHYFVSAWIPDPDATHELYSRVDDKLYSVGFINPEIEVLPGQEKTVSASLYMGPEVPKVLGELSPGLELTVDYGIFWPIAQPIFWLLKSIHQYVGNWGAAIILVTLLIKLLFFQLSATSYRSMAKMRKIQPEMQRLKERYGEDRQQMSQKVIELYKREKVNPLGGCLPILVQIPVFISLYYVLLESVELRQAPFIGWIQDLSAKDPYFVLPICMGLSMLVQQRLSPAPADPTQAKVMMMMPIVFTVLFMNFPAGLVLYWVVNNVLSISQQWVITKRIGA